MGKRGYLGSFTGLAKRLIFISILGLMIFSNVQQVEAGKWFQTTQFKIESSTLTNVDITTNPADLGRLSSSEDVSKVTLFLASADSDYLTGQVINVSGRTILS